MTDFGETEAQKGLLPDLSPRGDAGAVELPGVGFPVPFGDEEGQGIPDEVVWALGKVQAISGQSGYSGGLAGG